MQGTWENGQFVLASTKDDKIARLESEAAVMREKIKNQASRIRVLEGATNHAGGLKTDEAIAVLCEDKKRIDWLEDWGYDFDGLLERGWGIGLPANQTGNTRDIRAAIDAQMDLNFDRRLVSPST
jgi:hypothetical protein